MPEFFRDLGKKFLDSLKPKEQTPGVLLEMLKNEAVRIETALLKLDTATTSKKWATIDSTDFKLAEVLLAAAEINTVAQAYIADTNNRQTERVRLAYRAFQTSLRQSTLSDLPIILHKLTSDIEKIEILDKSFRKP